MGVSASLVLAAIGAVLIWAVNTTTSGFNIHTAGVILLVAVLAPQLGHDRPGQRADQARVVAAHTLVTHHAAGGVLIEPYAR